MFHPGGVASQKTLISVTPRQEWRSGMRRVNFVFIINIIDDCGEQTITLRKKFPQYPFDNSHDRKVFIDNLHPGTGGADDVGRPDFLAAITLLLSGG